MSSPGQINRTAGTIVSFSCWPARRGNAASRRTNLSGLAEDFRYLLRSRLCRRSAVPEPVEEAVGEIVSTSQLFEMMKLVRFQVF